MEMRRSIALTCILSVAAHGAIFGSMLRGAHPTTQGGVPTEVVLEAPREVSVDLQVVAPAPVPANTMRVDDIGALPQISGGALSALLDTGRDGHGGEANGGKAAALEDSNDGFFASPDPMSHLTRDQLQRIKTGETRASWEDRRSSREPSELTFLASGKGDRKERRAPSPFDPSRGALQSAPAQIAGADRIGTERTEHGDEQLRETGAAMLGSSVSRPGLGVHDGKEGRNHRVSANVMHARPNVVQAAVSIPSRERGKASDTVDSEQAVSARLQSIVHASNAGGIGNGGVGGSEGGGEAGAGGLSGAGSRARPMGEGGGDTVDFNTRDPNLAPYFRRLHAKIDPLWRDAFPKSALIELKQGMVILEFTIQPDGRAQVSWPPKRPSGVAEFDRNCANAIRQAAPFEPIPKELGRVALHVRAPFVAMNPVIH